MSDKNIISVTLDVLLKAANDVRLVGEEHRTFKSLCDCEDANIMRLYFTTPAFDGIIAFSVDIRQSVRYCLASGVATVQPLTVAPVVLSFKTKTPRPLTVKDCKAVHKEITLS